MAADRARTPHKWPTEISPDEDLYAIVDDKTDDVKFLVFTSLAKRANLIRDNKSWAAISSEEFTNEVDDPDLYIEHVGLDFIDFFDSNQSQLAGGEIKFSDYSSSAKKPVTAAGEKSNNEPCPPATQNIAINLKNRRSAISGADYGPLNPKEPNEEFWAAKADQWSVTPEEAKKSLCGNCVMFIVTDKMKECIASGIEQGGSGSVNAWDAINTAELGYCEAFDFKCAASRTCNAWVTGGPISDEVQSNRGVE